MTPIEEKIAKILALAERAGTEGEAAAAANRAQEIALKHGIELASIAPAGEAPDVQIVVERVKGKVDPWRRQLAQAVAESMGGDTLYSNEYRKWTGSITFYGPRGTTSAMVKIYQYLEDELDRLSRQAATTQLLESVYPVTAAQSMRWRRSWLLGATVVVAKRLKERAELIDNEAGGNALVVLKSAASKRADDDADTTSGYSPSFDTNALRAGVRAGKDVPLGDDELTREKEVLPR